MITINHVFEHLYYMLILNSLGGAGVCFELMLEQIWLCLFTSLQKTRTGWGINFVLILVCRWDFSNLPYSCIPDFRNVYLFMYDLFTFATHKCMYLYVLLNYQPYRCIEMSNLATYWCIAAVKRGAIPAAHVYHALYREFTAQLISTFTFPTYEPHHAWNFWPSQWQKMARGWKFGI